LSRSSAYHTNMKTWVWIPKTCAKGLCESEIKGTRQRAVVLRMTLRAKMLILETREVPVFLFFDSTLFYKVNPWTLSTC
ncbi:mCG1037580, partial [Mus musculus]